MRIVIKGEPVGKGRPRFSQYSVYTPKKTETYEQLVYLSFRSQVRQPMFEKSVPIRCEITACFGIPKSTSKKNREAMLNGKIRPTKKPDIDNIEKIILDALNKKAFYDDSQVVEIEVKKIYSETPCVIVEFEEVD